MLSTSEVVTPSIYLHRLIVDLLAQSRQCGLFSYDTAYLELVMREGLSLATRDKALRFAASKY